MKQFVQGITTALSAYIILISSAYASEASQWEAEVTYGVGSQVSYEGNLYRALQAHTANRDWYPLATPALWQRISDVQSNCAPWQEGLSYQLKDRVSFAGKYYQVRQAHTAFLGSNWSPNVTPALWSLIQKCEITPPVTAVEVINEISVPLDPGMAGKQSLIGIDSDHDGVRDDIQRFLAKNLGPDLLLYKRALHVARAAQQTLLVAETHDKAKARIAFNQWSIADDCFSAININGRKKENYMKEIKYDKQLEALIANTPERMLAYMQYADMVGGMVLKSSNKLVCEQ